MEHYSFGTRRMEWSRDWQASGARRGRGLLSSQTRALASSAHAPPKTPENIPHQFLSRRASFTQEHPCRTPCALSKADTVLISLSPTKDACNDTFQFLFNKSRDFCVYLYMSIFIYSHTHLKNPTFKIQAGEHSVDFLCHAAGKPLVGVVCPQVPSEGVKVKG